MDNIELIELIKSALERVKKEQKTILLTDYVDSNLYKEIQHIQIATIGQTIENLRKAAVLVPLVMVENDWHVLFIQRSEIEEDMHSGQVAFPGGGLEDGEDIEQGALRETFEEIGILPKYIEVIGKLSPIQTVSGYIVYPVVGIIPYPYQFSPSLSEVSDVFTIPLKWLEDVNNYEFKYVPVHVKLDGKIVEQNICVITYQPYDGHVLWGASARIVHNLLRIIKNE